MKSASQHPAVTGKIGARMSRIAAGQPAELAQPAAPRGGRGGYDVDDEVFFHGESGPASGRVVCHGAHGCTVDEAGGKRHQVTWDRVLGLKGRKTFPARVVDRGTGGAILEREDGSRFFAAGDVPVAEEPDALSYDESGQDQMLQKADQLARLGEWIDLLAAPTRRVPMPPGMPLLWELAKANPHHNPKTGQFAPGGGGRSAVGDKMIEPLKLSLAGWNGSRSQLRDLATGWYSKELQGKSFYNEDMGVDVQFSVEGKRTAFATSGNLRDGWRAEMVRVLPELIRRAIKVSETPPDQRRRYDTRMFHTLAALLSVGGKTLTAKITLREALRDYPGKHHKFYDITALEIDNGPVMSRAVTDASTSPLHLTGTRPSLVSVSDLARSIKGGG